MGDLGRIDVVILGKDLTNSEEIDESALIPKRSPPLTNRGWLGIMEVTSAIPK